MTGSTRMRWRRDECVKWYICNSIIHSYVWNLAYSEGKRETAGFLPASDREKDKKLYFVKICDWIGYINYCKEKCNV